MRASIASAAPPSAPVRRWPSRLLPYLPFGAVLWLTVCDGRVPAILSPTVERTLYLKLPIAGTRFHWRFLDRRAFLSGELTLRIVNAGRGRDETLVIFRDGAIGDGWELLDGTPRDGSAYFGFSTDRRFATAVGDSVIVTLVAPTDLRGHGPHSVGTLAKGTWVATGTYTALYGGTLNPIRDLVRMGDPPVAFLTCWDTEWVLRDGRDVGWMGPKPASEDEVSRFQRLRPDRGVDGRRCRSTI